MPSGGFEYGGPQERITDSEEVHALYLKETQGDENSKLLRKV